ncbi:MULTISPECIES: DUF349 domain-containing protein [Leeuwenhoekiella]|jgi:hypothetical protein|uniref:Chromosome segregation protein n=1 Tax=Leeuwenhoekiella blandensis (strain CECT 7118 / CCUG 51940 / KCTC 22103 / MED217) TaxID=398720 RepID=A3XN71_LEEBM|nr:MULTISPECIES: DUF349 domain-containing protein [Leeuwenhoekiella]EAQ49002.1 hypothetical protein MED217_10647 [Leeuwenhoekiella blandensis MED217]MAO44882.1 DUF349 domain-containing protein [Leeuwenhoekiella sp.]HCW63474.1 DUF349 domain-containing protein [Leeuwenhoekiella sp.]|tara:strand:+ start:928 stop:2973 length:2046 start_codon:yes stop_codon:yes gene_type:complete
MSEEKKASNTDKNVEETASKDSIKESQEAKTSASETQEASTTQEEELVTESIDVIKDAKTNDANEEEHDEDFVAEDEEDDQDSDPDDLDAALNEDSEDESASERHDIPKKDYDSLSKEELIKEFKYLLNNHKVQAIKEHVTELRAAFISQFEDEQEQAKEKFLEEGGNIIDFRYYSPLKKEFNSLYFDYRDKRNNYYKNLKKDLNANLETRNALIEELKELKNEVGGEDSINTTFEKFKDIQERWRNAGNIPRDRYNLVWNNYHHHIENFYDFLHLNREFRDKDFKENLDKKLKLIEQAEELAQEPDVNRAFKELQMLHKIWKEEVGPVSKEYREEIWEKFSAATRKIHDARQEYFKNIDKVYEENLDKKQEVIAKIETIAANPASAHNGWQKQMKEVNALREEFFKIGKVPKKENEPTWKAFKKATREFNHNKNSFYKNQKKQQYENLQKKLELVQIAEDNKDNEDIKVTIDLMKRIQADWKKIGHVPRKDSDKIWKRFKKACNHFFDRLHAEKKEVLEEEKGNLEEKNTLLEKVKNIELSGNHEDDLKTIKSIIKEWKDTGRVPHSKKSIEQDFNKVLDGLFKKLDLSKKESELIKYENRVAAIADEDSNQALNKEHYFITKKIDEVKAEINQLENNLGFFQHVDDDNPLVKEVHKNIAAHKKTLEIWKAKLSKLKSLY